MRLGIYVGSFNPVHKGHVSIVRSILRKGLCDKVMVIVTGNYWNKQDLLPIEDRIQMWKFYENENIIIDEKHNTIEKTYQLFRALREELDDELFLILGADNIVSFSRWVNYQELLQYPFIVIKRNDIGKRELKKLLKGYNKDNYDILDIPTIHISSTEIRENLDDYSKISHMVGRKVYDYLVKVYKR